MWPHLLLSVPANNDIKVAIVELVAKSRAKCEVLLVALCAQQWQQVLDIRDQARGE